MGGRWGPPPFPPLTRAKRLTSGDPDGVQVCLLEKSLCDRNERDVAAAHL